MNIKWTKKDQLKLLAKSHLIKKVDNVLDIGCGINPQNYIKAKTHICVDPHLEYLHHVNKNIASSKDKDREYVLLNCLWDDAVNLFPKKSIDSVFLIDLIEHLPKAKGRKLLKQTEEITRKQIVIFTPLGFIEQNHPDGKDAWGLSGGKWQEHKSGWVPKDFDDSWDIYACKEYHYVNNVGEKYKIPKGAFFAIKNINIKEKNTRNTIFQIIKKAFNLEKYKK